MSHIKHNKQELLVYTIIWGLLFVVPLLSEYIAATQRDASDAFNWGGVLFVWRQYALLLAAFIIHNFFLAPLLVAHQRRQLYFSLVAVLLTLFVVVQCAQRPGEGSKPPEMGMEDHQAPMPVDDGMPPPDWSEPPMGADHPAPPDKHAPFDRHGPNGGPRDMHRPLGMEQNDVVAVITLLLMLGLNIGVKYYFRHQKDRQQMALLEKKNLEQQLEYLRYQINPHFLMNTLNNIHALVDIDTEQAKESIVELSKIMRFVLYEGAKQTVPLERELAFIRDYIKLMRIRVTDRISINVDLPKHVPNSQIPPLLLITFVENAFKHGVSYRQPSFIDIHADTDDGQHLHFTCSNSKQPAAEEQHGGVGLQNVKKRLDLIYANNYTLDISDEADTYNISLLIPFLE